MISWPDTSLLQAACQETTPKLPVETSWSESRVEIPTGANLHYLPVVALLHVVLGFDPKNHPVKFRLLSRSSELAPVIFRLLSRSSEIASRLLQGVPAANWVSEGATLPRFRLGNCGQRRWSRINSGIVGLGSRILFGEMGLHGGMS